MDLLSRTWRKLRPLLHPSAWFTAGLIAVALALELFGRRVAATDFYDGLAFVVLGLLGLLIVQRHRQSPLGWVSALVRSAKQVGEELGRRFALEFGIDLRGDPPIPVGFPRIIPVTLTTLTVLGLALLLIMPLLPAGLRLGMVHISYLVYLVFLAGLWIGLAAGIVGAFVLPLAMIHDEFVSRHDGPGQRSQRGEGLALVVYFGTLLFGASLLPLWVPLLICLAALALNVFTMTLPANPDIWFVWRYRNQPTIRSIPSARGVACEFAFLTLSAINLVLLSCGSSVLTNTPILSESISGSGRDLMPVTTTLGLTLAWLAPGALSLLVVQRTLGRMRDPARPCQPVVFLGGSAAPSALRELGRYFLSKGWQTRSAPAKSQLTDVPVELIEGPPKARADGREWPLQVTAEVVQRPAILERLRHRDAIQKRRRLLNGLQRLFKYACRQQFRCGSGFWVAPHFWFIEGLKRDTPEDELNLDGGTIFSGVVGPPYHRVLPRPVRHYIYQVLRALQIDLIFVEDGVGFKRLSRVLRLLFEVFDVYDGRRRAEEIHFQGVTGVRVLIHEYQLTDPFRSEVYPEPDYENLGRARILHVFRDRGEQEEKIDSPLDNTFAPAPAGAM